MRRYRKDRKDWSERVRLRRFPLVGKRLFDVERGYVTVTRVWKERHWAHNCPRIQPGHWSMVYEVRTECGMRYVEEGSRMYGRVTDERGKLVDEWLFVLGVPREGARAE